MLSWVFRNRHRLVAIYGRVRRLEPACEPVRPEAAAADPPPPGCVVWRRHWAIVWPMSPALALEQIPDDEDWGDWL